LSPIRLSIPSLLAAVLVTTTNPAFCQSRSTLNLATHSASTIPALDVARLTLPESVAAMPAAPEASPDSENSSQTEQHGLVGRSAKRVLRDQKSLYLAPFKPSNLKWDALVLIPTGILLAEDRHIETSARREPAFLFQYFECRARCNGRESCSHLGLRHQNWQRACERDRPAGVGDTSQHLPYLYANAIDRGPRASGRRQRAR
jgi:hypothetical protein